MTQNFHQKIAEAALATTGVALPAAWLADVDIALRIILSLVGIISGVYAALYYRKRYKQS